MVVRVGVVGTGMIGSDHVDRLSRRVVGSRVSSVFDLATDRAREVAAAVGAVVAPTALDVINDPNVDAVVIASPGDLHAEQVLACISAGKPVMCEKPLATTIADCIRVVEAEVAHGARLVQVGFMRRYDRAFLDVKAAMDDGSIGEPLLAHAVHRNPSVPDTFVGEMSLTDSLVHEFDAFRWLFGDEIVATTVVSTRRSPLGAGQLRDPQIVLIELASGSVVTVESFVHCQYGYDVRCEVVGTLGTVTLDNPRTVTTVSNGRRSEPVPADWRVRFAQAYVDELQTWVDGLSVGVVSGPSAWDGYAATAVAESAVASYTRGERTTVSLAERPWLYR